MLTTTKAIVLHTTKYGETKLFVDLFTKEFGRMSMVTSISNKGRSRGNINLFQLFNIIEVELDMKPAVSMQKIKSARISYPTVSIPFDPYKISISLFLSEFLYYALRNEQRSTILYEYIEKSIIWLDSREKGFSNFHLIFMLKLSKFIGIWPNTEDFHAGCFFNLREGCFTSIIPSHSDYLKEDETNAFRVMVRLNYSTMHLLKLTRIERNRCANVIMKYYRLHIPNFPELKSFSIMQELFAD